MAEASMIGNFNTKVVAFNNAIKTNDTETAVEIGVEMIRIALDECVKPNVSPTIKETYRKQCLAVMSHLANFASRPAVRVQQSAGGDTDTAGGVDPYYVTKQWFSDEAPKLNFKNIIGVQEVKDAFMVDVVAPLRPEFRDIYRKFRGDEMGSQILLFGPPGTGKTHIVKCLAGALNCKIAVVQTSEVLASVVGVAEKNVRDIFAQAAELDRCIIFLDEIDSICSDRSSDDARNTKSILTTLLTCMDGFVKTKKEGQLRIIVAATNLPWKLDSALKRGGRFETQIYVPLPDAPARKMFVENALKNMPCAAGVTVDWLVNMLDGYSGADIKAIMRQVANRPLRRAVMDVINNKAELAQKECVTVADCKEVIQNYINSITTENLLLFEAYRRGITYAELLKLLSTIAVERGVINAGGFTRIEDVDDATLAELLKLLNGQS